MSGLWTPRGPTWHKALHRREGRIIWGSGVGALDIPEADVLEVFENILPWHHNALVDLGEQYMLDVSFRDLAQPANLYFGLCNDTLVDTDTMVTLAGELSGNGYARQTIPTTNVGFPTLALDAGDYQTITTTETFTAAGGAWAAVNTLFINDALSGTAGRLIAWSALSATRTLQDGDSLDTTMTVKLA